MNFYNPKYSEHEVKEKYFQIMKNLKHENTTKAVIDLACLNYKVSNHFADLGFKVKIHENVNKIYRKQCNDRAAHRLNPKITLSNNSVVKGLMDIKSKIHLANLDLCNRWERPLYEILPHIYKVDNVVLTIVMNRNSARWQPFLYQYAKNNTIEERLESQLRVHKEEFLKFGFEIKEKNYYVNGGNTPLIAYLLKKI